MPSDKKYKCTEKDCDEQILVKQDPVDEKRTIETYTCPKHGRRSLRGIVVVEEK